MGRRVERQALNALIDAVRTGERRVLVRVGEPGIGKMALHGLVDLESSVRCRHPLVRSALIEVDGWAS